MKIEDQVCSLEQAKKLQELGITAMPWFQWADVSTSPSVFPAWQSHAGDRYPAFSVAELGQMLPNSVITRNGPSSAFESFRAAVNGLWYCYAEYANEDRVWHRTSGFTQAQALATMLIYLLKNNLITAEEANQRLNS